MSEDIVTRLHKCAGWHKGTSADCEEWLDAATEITRLREELTSAKRAAKAYEAWKFPEDIQALTVEIERLREENARMRAALKPFADDADCKFATYSNHYLRDAAAAIREGGKDG